GQMAWELKLGSPSISTRFLSVTVTGRSTFLMPLEPRAVRVEVRAGNQIISVPVSATDGFQEVTRDVVLQSDEDNRMLYVPNTVTLQITDEPEVATVTVHLLDATTGASLQQLEQVPFEIAF